MLKKARADQGCLPGAENGSPAREAWCGAGRKWRVRAAEERGAAGSGVKVWKWKRGSPLKYIVKTIRSRTKSM